MLRKSNTLKSKILSNVTPTRDQSSISIAKEDLLLEAIQESHQFIRKSFVPFLKNKRLYLYELGPCVNYGLYVPYYIQWQANKDLLPL